jgi:2',3'-cyclic-nucleotide 2'-phosphodiesterase (5'-nucleotidase family)
MLLGMTSCERQQTEDIIILYTNDVAGELHGNVSFAEVKGYKDRMKSEHKYVALVDAGDFFDGKVSNFSDGKYIVEIMNAVGYDVVTLGNQEFSIGLDALAKNIDDSDFEYTSCNLKYVGKGKDPLKKVKPYVIKRFGPTKIAFIGVTTPETLKPGKSASAAITVDGELIYGFYEGNEGQDLYDQVQKTVNKVRKRVDYVIVLAHLGHNSVQAGFRCYDLIANTTGIDVVIDGHSHSVVYGDPYPNAAGEDVILVSTGTKLENLGELIIATDGTISTMLISEYDKQDEEIANSIATIYDELGVVLDEKIGELEFPLVISDENGIRQIRSRETNLGDFCADALREELHTDIAIVNGGGIRKTIEAGEVTYGNLLDVMPFGNTTGSCYATGQQILDVLEFTSRSTDALYVFEDNAVGENGAFSQVSGLRYTIDTSIPSGVLVDADGMFTGIEGERRVKDVMVLEGDEYVPIDPEKTYTVGSTDYILFKNGDGNTVFHDCERIIANGETDVDLLIRYFQKQESFEDYREVQNRITVK